jgi:Zn-finger nucleic acid-binding protein
MSSYERNGVVVDQCTDCRGLFLDRGELEKLISAENNWQSASRPAPQPGHSSSHADYSHKKRKRSFLEELFD